VPLLRFAINACVSDDINYIGMDTQTPEVVKGANQIKGLVTLKDKTGSIKLIAWSQKR